MFDRQQTATGLIAIFLLLLHFRAVCDVSQGTCPMQGTSFFYIGQLISSTFNAKINSENFQLSLKPSMYWFHFGSETLLDLVSFAWKFQFRLHLESSPNPKNVQTKKAFPDQIPKSRFSWTFSSFRNRGNSPKDLCCLRGGGEMLCDWKNFWWSLDWFGEQFWIWNDFKIGSIPPLVSNSIRISLTISLWAP